MHRHPPDAPDALVLLHGLGGSARTWDPVIGLLSAEREVIVLDMPGFGDAEPLPKGIQATAANLAAALHERHADVLSGKPHVAGNSLGGWVALELGRAGRVASVTALSPAGLWRKPIGERRFHPRRWARRLRPLISAALRTRWGRERMLSTFAAHPERIPPEAGRELILSWIEARGYDAANQAMRAHVFDPAGYPRLPVTLAWGERDRLVGPPVPARRPAGARYLTLPGVGHTPMWDDPELIARTLLEGSSVSAAA